LAYRRPPLGEGGTDLAEALDRRVAAFRVQEEGTSLQPAVRERQLRLEEQLQRELRLARRRLARDLGDAAHGEAAAEALVDRVAAGAQAHPVARKQRRC